ncbi:histidine kinase [Actinomycetospora sp. NBRC 106375]|uniref:PP2C family protein-serine/threonine phosphatase n=1 Tax=Actinomycetospora sp. NBRC 106375 TaxID=3032207 RepID=UPI0024A41B47|nr:SpoIIE family protein phosphatase [Actinomycetospora sp. NBRC 106375]GLZ48927.1 histidine kinase [Actinomycetospora sp. NBRC 106375]
MTPPGLEVLLEETLDDLYERAPCGYLSTLPDGGILKINATMLGWLGLTRADVVGQKRFSDLLSVGGRIYHETHFAPLLRMQGEVRGVALDLVTTYGPRLPVLVSATMTAGPDGEPLLARMTVFEASDRRAYERELLRARQEAEQERERLQHLATVLQRTLLPPALPRVPGLTTAGYYHSAAVEQIGGDFYDLFPLDHDRWGFFLGDVCGKGPAAAVVTSLLRYTLRATAVYESDPVSVLEALDSGLRQQRATGERGWCTVVFGLLTPLDDGFRVSLASGGHPPALVMRAGGRVEAMDTVGGQPVGLLPDPRFVAATAVLGPGDGLVLYTDGLTEARRPDGTMIDDTLPQVVAGLVGLAAQGVVDGLAELLTSLGPGLADDAAILALTVRGASLSPSD